MRLLAEIVIIGALIYLGWEQPFKELLPWTKSELRKPVATDVAARPVRPIVRATPQATGEWMWDPAHQSALDRPAYDPREPSKRYLDASGRKYWIDAKGVRHYDP